MKYTRNSKKMYTKYTQFNKTTDYSKTKATSVNIIVYFSSLILSDILKYSFQHDRA